MTKTIKIHVDTSEAMAKIAELKAALIELQEIREPCEGVLGRGTYAVSFDKNGQPVGSYKML